MLIPKRKNKAPSVARTIRFPEAQFQQLMQTAQAHHVSFSYLVRLCCTFAMENLDESDDDKRV
nr:hypothetical protein [Maliibacterium massiliense]